MHTFFLLTKHIPVGLKNSIGLALVESEIMGKSLKTSSAFKLQKALSKWTRIRSIFSRLAFKLGIFTIGYETYEFGVLK